MSFMEFMVFFFFFNFFFPDSKEHTQIRIEENSTGHSFEKIFGKYLDSKVSKIDVEEPYIRNMHQVNPTLSYA